MLQLKEIRKDFIVESLLQDDAGAGKYHIVVDIKSNENLTQLEQDLQTATTHRSLVGAEYKEKKNLLETKLSKTKNEEESVAILENELLNKEKELILLENKKIDLKIGMDELKKISVTKKNI